MKTHGPAKRILVYAGEGVLRATGEPTVQEQEPKMRGKRKIYSVQERMALVGSITKSINSGTHYTAACKDAGINPSTYYAWLKASKRKRSRTATYSHESEANGAPSHRTYRKNKALSEKVLEAYVRKYGPGVLMEVLNG